MNKDDIYKYSKAQWYKDCLAGYTPEKVLESRPLMDDFIRTLSYFGLDNASGSSHCNHRIATYKNGVLFISHHHVDSICYIKIGENPLAKLILGSQDSRCSGNPEPSLENSKWHIVWGHDGAKMKDGPWVTKIQATINELIDICTDKANKMIGIYNKHLETVRKENDDAALRLVANWNA